MMAQEQDFLKARQQFDRLCELVRQAGREGWRMDEIERELMPRLMWLGREFLEGHVQAQGNGDVGPTVTSDDGTLRRSKKLHSRRYLSAFGELVIARYVYAVREGQKAEYVPLDARLGLPAGENSYLLEDWQQRLSVKDSFGESVDDLKAILGHGVSVRTAEGMNRAMAAHAEGYRAAQPLPPPKEEAELLVVTADGKGVVMRRPVEKQLQDEATAKARSEKKGKHKTGKKQMAYVGAVYTIDRFRRTANDVLDEMARRSRAEARPRPQHKRVWAEMTRVLEGEPCTGRELLFCNLAVECEQRNSSGKKTLICLLDGERSLWDMQRGWFPQAIGILDIFHVSERIWEVAHCVYARGSDAAREFATRHLRMILEGKVGYVLRNWRPLADKYEWRGEKRTTVMAAITYFENNREHMRYNEYMAAGYPIGSGVAEGTCRHLVKDRMELTGMRWEVAGAQAMLHTRAIHINGEWDQFVAYRVEKEQDALYGPGTLYETLTYYTQPA
jgi:hypothetical protein